MNYESLFTGLFTFLGLAVPAYLVYLGQVKKINKENAVESYKLKAEISKLTDEKRELEIDLNAHKKKSEYLPRIMQMKFQSKFQSACDKIFKRTIAESFLIFVGVNAKYPISFVSCVFSEYKDESFPAEDEYKNLDITKDTQYNEMLHFVESNPEKLYKINTFELPMGTLKTAYYQEQVLYSRVGFLSREPIDPENDFIMYYSTRTFADQDYTEREEKTIQMIVDSEIKPLLKKIQQFKPID